MRILFKIAASKLILAFVISSSFTFISIVSIDQKEALEIFGFENLPEDVREIKKKYNKLALTMHPDRHLANGMTQEQAENKFKQLQEAKEVLEGRGGGKREGLANEGVYDYLITLLDKLIYAVQVEDTQRARNILKNCSQELEELKKKHSSGKQINNFSNINSMFDVILRNFYHYVTSEAAKTTGFEVVLDISSLKNPFIADIQGAQTLQKLCQLLIISFIDPSETDFKYEQMYAFMQFFDEEIIQSTLSKITQLLQNAKAIQEQEIRLLLFVLAQWKKPFDFPRTLISAEIVAVKKLLITKLGWLKGLHVIYKERDIELKEELSIMYIGVLDTNSAKSEIIKKVYKDDKKYDITLLMRAARYTLKAIVVFLVENGADINFVGGQWELPIIFETILLWPNSRSLFSMLARESITFYLLSQKVNIQFSYNHENHTFTWWYIKVLFEVASSSGFSQGFNLLKDNYNSEFQENQVRIMQECLSTIKYPSQNRAANVEYSIPHIKSLLTQKIVIDEQDEDESKKSYPLVALLGTCQNGGYYRNNQEKNKEIILPVIRAFVQNGAPLDVFYDKNKTIRQMIEEDDFLSKQNIIENSESSPKKTQEEADRKTQEEAARKAKEEAERKAKEEADAK